MRFVKNFGSIKVSIDFDFTIRPIKEGMFLELSSGAGLFKVRVDKKILKELKEFLES